MGVAEGDHGDGRLFYKQFEKYINHTKRCQMLNYQCLRVFFCYQKNIDGNVC